MLAYLTILAASLCGYGGAPVWTMFLASAGLFSVSYAQHQGLIGRGLARGFQQEVADTLWRSGMNALTTTCGAFLFGMALKSFG